MKIERVLQPRSSIEQFADQHGLVMEIRERPLDCMRLGRFIASFKDCEEKGDGVLISAYGNGNTEEEAISDYARRISGKTLALHSTSISRKDVRVPILEQP